MLYRSMWREQRPGRREGENTNEEKRNRKRWNSSQDMMESSPMSHSDPSELLTVLLKGLRLIIQNTLSKPGDIIDSLNFNSAHEYDRR